jgi:predicted TIM-barrel fold metal-dependent hydrolase
MADSLPIITAADLIKLLDDAAIQRAVVLSCAYMYGSPSRTVENEYEKVKAENDWVSQQVGLYSHRLTGFCGFNPLKDYALEEMARCAGDKGVRTGIKLHIGNSAIDYHNAQHMARLREVFAAANSHKMAIVVHMRASISRKFAYGKNEAEIFLNEILPAVPNVTVQLAHLAGAGSWDDPPSAEALQVFVNACAKGDKRMKHTIFDVTTVVTPDIPPEHAERISRAIRTIGLKKVFYGSDAAAGGNLPPKEGWAAFHKLPLTKKEFRTIANNIPPYLHPYRHFG